MPVKFKVIKKSQPGVKGGGTKKYYASAHITHEKSLKRLIKEMEKTCAVDYEDIRTVLLTLVDAFKQSLLNGEIVRLGEIGSLRIVVSSDGADSENDVNADIIKSSRIVFTPSTTMIQELKDLEYVKA